MAIADGADHGLALNPGQTRRPEPIPNRSAPADRARRRLLWAVGVAGVLVGCTAGAAVLGIWHAWGKAPAVQKVDEKQELQATLEQLRAELSKQQSHIESLVQSARDHESPPAKEPAPSASPAVGPPAGPAAAKPAQWTVLFRADDPSVWNTPSYLAERWAAPLLYAPEDMRYVRLRRLDTSEYLILPLSRYEVQNGSLPTSEAGYWWNGTAKAAYGGYHLGIVQAPRFKFVAPRGMVDVMNDGWDGFSGSGFGHADGVNDHQHYCWLGKEIERTIFEIAVSPGPLTTEERRYLLPRQ
jgi:hypothetical protein